MRSVVLQLASAASWAILALPGHAQARAHGQRHVHLPNQVRQDVSATESTTPSALPVVNLPGGVSVTPHAQYSSSVGVLGCKIDTNRVAYWPSSPSCSDICIELTNPANGVKVNVIKIDQSGGAFDISYDAWNMLKTGQGAKENPVQDGGLPVDAKFVSMDACMDILQRGGGKLSYSAANSVNFVNSCLSGTGLPSTAGLPNFVKDNYQFINIADPQCKWGVDEVCTLPPPDVDNKPQCPGSTLGIQTVLPESERIVDLEYGTGKDVVAAG